MRSWRRPSTCGARSGPMPCVFGAGSCAITLGGVQCNADQANASAETRAAHQGLATRTAELLLQLHDPTYYLLVAHA